MNEVSHKLIVDVVRWATKNDTEDCIWFHPDDLRPLVDCSDIFHWACADAVEVTEDNFADMDASFKDDEDHWNALFAARQRKMRPQGPFYKFIKKENWHLFDACGPERENECRYMPEDDSDGNNQ